MKIFVIFFLFFFSCNNSDQNITVQKPDSLKTDISHAEEKKVVIEEPLIADTGQTWYKISVTKNDSPFIKYEGDWPILLTTNGFGTLEMKAKKGALVISHGITLYMYDWPSTGRLAVVNRPQAKGDINMIVMPAINDVYGLAISPDSGYVNMVKNDGKLMTGNFEAYTTNDPSTIYRVTGQFLNIKPH